MEDVPNSVDRILESAVFGVPDADFAKSVIAALVPERAPLNEASTKAYVATELAKFKNPKR
ncbi:AMP-binding enzyme [Yoonia sp.]|uniref:AMP-binding enzyme n=1 Tax=Yoonia sp. TaxID=2212373 RepID=UPI0039761948